MKPIKRLFISQPMSGLSDETILETRKKAVEYISSVYPDNEIVVIDSFKPQGETEYNAVSAVNLLGQALSNMAGAEIIYFVPGWKESRGCQIENEVARRWLEEVGVELIEDGMEKVDIELTTDELERLKKAANDEGMSIHKYIGLKLKQAIADGSLEKMTKELK